MFVECCRSSSFLKLLKILMKCLECSSCTCVVAVSCLCCVHCCCWKIEMPFIVSASFADCFCMYRVFLKYLRFDQDSLPSLTLCWCCPSPYWWLFALIVQYCRYVEHSLYIKFILFSMCGNVLVCKFLCRAVILMLLLLSIGCR